jgi:formiminotetrahydrofolate cyclodeaminase
LQVNERQDHPGPGSVCAVIGEAGGELLDMAAQLG